MEDAITRDMAPENALSLTGGNPKKFVSEQIDKGNDRYSDEDLEEFKTIILDKIKKVEEDYLQDVEYILDSEENDSSLNIKNIKEGSTTIPISKLKDLASNKKDLILKLEQALVRIEDKTYGICRKTGKLIPKERLRAVPHATLSIEAKNDQK